MRTLFSLFVLQSLLLELAVSSVSCLSSVVTRAFSIPLPRRLQDAARFFSHNLDCPSCRCYPRYRRDPGRAVCQRYCSPRACFRDFKQAMHQPFSNKSVQRPWHYSHFLLRMRMESVLFLCRTGNRCMLGGMCCRRVRISSINEKQW